MAGVESLTYLWETEKGGNALTYLWATEKGANALTIITHLLADLNARDYSLLHSISYHLTRQSMIDNKY